MTLPHPNILAKLRGFGHLHLGDGIGLVVALFFERTRVAPKPYVNEHISHAVHVVEGVLSPLSARPFPRDMQAEPGTTRCLKRPGPPPIAVSFLRMRLLMHLHTIPPAMADMHRKSNMGSNGHNNDLTVILMIILAIAMNFLPALMAYAYGH